ncbi:hypothetical protein HBI56_025280 [Parastagonospora nodorum]|uniref:Uncharacterized protein n=1 Tax=Phaeosphaeria nodorum (strain SN15 / ATCC MYA-4574 / FGSC 10173) TaxID=321614 RepID=A0A7U2EXF9_PHANO|nr:hypothetical protein HBH56_012940 [Parastagonospora nodorum]QRC94825.1 hypothetical protein JI435_406420 [Parastagonospora nodorum SN15]KAH3990480.1 hypothetical protein HBH52_010920 [Parastagonospora nodorum]KAH4008503.1 hypothetical protein HBI13_234750 [Parastagonospora nodorum]KAH4075229.1 hypothetical protein HBH50_035860 [Parastagonospora nodorum]
MPSSCLSLPFSVLLYSLRTWRSHLRTPFRGQGWFYCARNMSAPLDTHTPVRADGSIIDRSQNKSEVASAA